MSCQPHTAGPAQAPKDISDRGRRRRRRRAKPRLFKPRRPASANPARRLPAEPLARLPELPALRCPERIEARPASGRVRSPSSPHRPGSAAPLRASRRGSFGWMRSHAAPGAARKLRRKGRLAGFPTENQPSTEHNKHYRTLGNAAAISWSAGQSTSASRTIQEAARSWPLRLRYGRVFEKTPIRRNFS